MDSEILVLSKQVFLVIVFNCIYLCNMYNFQPYILTSQQNRANMQTQQDLFKKIKLTQITNHLFIHDQKVDYLLLLSAKHELKLYTFKNGFFQILSNYVISPVNPVSFTLGNHGEVYLLHSCGMMIWTVSQIISQCQPEKVKIQFASPPIKALPLGKDNFVIICQQNAICMICSNGQQNFNCHRELALNQTIFDIANDSVYALIPSSTNRFPYLFSGQQILLWNTQNFFDSYIKYCQSYYYQDQILPQAKNVMCFSAQQQMVYIFLKEELIIIHAKKTNQKVAFVFNIRLKIKTKWGGSQLACSISNHTGRLAYIGKDRIGQILPFQYKLLRKSIKQKSDCPINFVYYLTHNLMLLVSHSGPDNICKIYLHRCDELN